ncbi:MAG: hypothetical protein ABIG29_01090 [Candidatus Nealsonbacteria bacterium]
MVVRKFWQEEIEDKEYEKLIVFYNVEALDRLHVDPPLDNLLIQKITTIEKVEERNSEFPDYANILEVSSTVILIKRTCSLCSWKLACEILEVLRSESDVDTDIPFKYSLATGSYKLDKQPFVWRYEKIKG